MALDKFKPYLFVSAGEQSNKYLTPTITNGIAQFQAQRAQSITGLTVRIDPIQSGSGDPSPDNIRPISGRTGMTVTAAGKNLANFVDGYGVETLGNVMPIATRTATIDPIIINENIRYRYSMSGSGAGIYAVWKGDTLVRRISGIPSGSLLNTSGGDRFYICAYASPDVVVTKDAYHPMVTVESADYATYEPFYGTTYPVTWESIAGTVYGGTLDVVSGVLTVTHGYILLDGTQDIRRNGRTEISQRAFVSIADKAFGATNIQSNRFAVTSSFDAVGKMTGRPENTVVEFHLPLEGTENTAASCKAWFADNNTQLVYELATPQTYRLTGADVRTIAGFNQIYSDAGPVIDIKF